MTRRRELTARLDDATASLHTTARQRDEARAQRDHLAVRVVQLQRDLATTNAVARHQLVRNAELASGRPVVVIDMPPRRELTAGTVLELEAGA